MHRYFRKIKANNLYFSFVLFLYFIAAECLGEIISPLPFSEFKIINKENYETIRSAELLIDFKASQSYTLEALQNESDREIAYLNELQKNAVDENRKQQIEHLKTRIPSIKRLRANKTRFDNTSRKKYVVDVKSNQYRLDQIPENEETAASSGIHLLTTVVTNGKLITYLKKPDQAFVRYNQKQSAKQTPSRLGTIDPDIFDYNTFESRHEIVNLDGHEAVKYEITFDNWKNKTLIYADPALGYRYRKLESYRNNQLIQTIEAKDYKLFGDIYFPTVHKKVIYRKDQSNITETINVLDVKFNIEISPEVYKIRYTNKTKITDDQLNETYSLFDNEEIIDLELENDAVIDKIIESKSKNTHQHDEISIKGRSGQISNQSDPLNNKKRKEPIVTHASHRSNILILCLFAFLILIIVIYVIFKLKTNKK